MVNGMLIKISFLLSVVPLTLSEANQTLCFKNSTLLETTGDAILTVFVDANYGRYCNISSSKGLQQMSTALHVTRALNKYNHVPGWRLGLRMFDACQNGIKVLRRVLEMAVEPNCAPDYKMGVLVPSRYDSVLDPVRDHSGLPITVYEEQNLTEPLIDILAHYLSTRYATVDLALASTDHVLDRFLRITRDAGVCVKSDGRNNDGGTSVNVAETVIVAIGEKSDVKRWLREREETRVRARQTWLLLPLDNSDIDDLVPAGSYVIKPEAFGLSNADESLESSEYTMNHSSYLLGIGRAIVGLTEVLQDVRERNCPVADDDGNRVASRFRSKPKRQETRDSDVYEALHMQPSSHSVKYVIAMKTQRDLVDVALYEIEVSKSRVLAERMLSGMPGLCLQNLIGNCENCTNFQERLDASITEDIAGGKILKSNVYILIFLIAIACGTLVCCVIVTFIVYRFATRETLDGNPALTIVLILANMFTLLTALPFCMADDYFGAEDLNARKIFLCTLAFGLTFSIMLSRTLFLALSTSGIYVAHINGYLQSLMAFFMSGVQVAISIMYFVLNTVDSAVIVRSPIFIALLGYDIFLLISLFVSSCFITQIQRNYHEGRCFLGTALGLLIVWTIWPICFVLMRQENRDTIVSFGTIGTVYLIILGVLTPKVYCMITHPYKRKNLVRRFDSVYPPINPAVDTIVPQSLPLYNYVLPARESQILRIPPKHSDHYGNLSTSSKYLDRYRSPIRREMPAYNNYGFHEEMEEVNDCRLAPQICVENTEALRKPEVSPDDVTYARPRIYKAQKMVLEEKKSERECASSGDNFSSALTPQNGRYPRTYTNRICVGRERRIDEEDEEERNEDQDQEDKRANRVTRF